MKTKNEVINQRVLKKFIDQHRKTSTFTLSTFLKNNVKIKESIETEILTIYEAKSLAISELIKKDIKRKRK